MSQRRRVLLITYYFPPSGGSGVQRPLKFVKYLPRHGWDPVVLTVRPDASFPARDEALERDVPVATEIHRTGIFDPYVLYRKLSGGGPVDMETVARWGKLPRRTRWMSGIRAALFVPDARIGWWPFAVPRAAAIHRRNPVDVVLSTAPPFTAHLIGRSVAKRLERPWVADYRDPWTRAVFYPRRPAPAAALDRRLERRCLAAANRNIVVTPTMIDEFRQDDPDLDRHRFTCLPNGYDPEDFDGVDPPREGRLTVLHTGSLFANRRPEAFFQALESMMRDDGALSERLRVVFLGRIDADTERRATRPPLDGIVRVLGYVPHAESVSWLRRAHLLLLPTGQGPEARHLATGKIFEYIASGTPVLALAPEGEARRIVTETGSGFVVDPGDVAGVRAILEKALDAHARGALLDTNRKEEEVQSYSRAEQVGRLAGILDEAARRG